MRVLATAATAILGLSLTLTAFADDVLEASRKEKARREALAKKKGKTTASGKEPATVISNRNLKEAGGEGPSRLSQVTGDSSPPAKPTQAPGADKKPADGAAAAASGGQDEAYWRGRMAEANAGVENARKELADLNTHINELRREVTSIDDGYLRQKKTGELLAAQEQLSVLQKKVEAAQQGLGKVREEGRRAGAPAGWLR